MAATATFPASIGNGVEIFTSKEHPFGTDAVLLADFAAPKAHDNTCDLGAGCGIIPFLWARSNPPAHITAVELQGNAVQLMQKSLLHNALEGLITVVQADIRQPQSIPVPAGSFSLVSMNPPYFADGSGYKSEDSSQMHARHECTCTPEDLMCCADRLLKFGGRLCLCHKPERLADILCAMRAAGIEPKRLRFVCAKPSKPPYLFLIEGRKGGGKQLTVLPNLCVQQENGHWSEEMLKIYGEYGDGTKK